MPTVFEKLDAGLAGNSVAAKVSEQTGSLGSISNLIEHPPHDIGDLTKSIQEMPLPDWQFGGDLTSTVTSLKGAIPSDFSGTIFPLTSRLKTLQTSVTGDLVQEIDKALLAVKAVYKLTHIDFSAHAEAGGAAAPPAPAAGGAPAGGAPAPAPAPAGPAPAPPPAAAMDQANNLLNALPSPLNVETLLAWLNDGLGQLQLDVMVRQVPLLDEIRDPLATLSLWKGLTSDQIRDQMAATITQLTGYITASMDVALAGPTADLTAMLPKLHADELTAIADGITARLADLKTAVVAKSNADIQSAVTAINGFLDQFDAMKPALQADVIGKSAALQARLKTLSDDVDDRMSHVVSIVRQDVALDFLEAATDALKQAAGAQPMAELEKVLHSAVLWLEELAGSLDLGAIKEPIKKIADGAKTTVDEFDAAMETVTLEVQKAFGQVEALIDKVDIAALTAQVQKAIDDFKTTLIQKLTDLFKPVQDAVTKVVEQIDAGVAQFNPQEIVDSLKDVIDKLTGVLDDGDIKSAIKSIHDTLDTATNQLKTLSFAPLTDQVIKDIDDLTAALKAIDPSTLSITVKGALTAAVAILPPDVTPLTNPILDEFGKLIQEGPVPLVNAVKDQPAKLLAQVNNFEPKALIGDALSKPFNDLLTQADAFKPSKLLAPLDGELNKLKDRLKQSADPGLAIKPLESPFNDFLRMYDRLKPEAITQPLDDGIHQVTDAILKAIPIEDVLSQVQGVLKQVDDAIHIGDKLVALLQNVHEKLAALADSPAQLSAWVESIMVKVDAIADTTPIQTELTKLAAALDAAKSAGIAARFNAGADTVLAALNALNVDSRLPKIVSGYRAITPASVAALADSPEKAALNTMLVRLNPMQESFSDPWLSLGTLGKSVAAAKDGLATSLAGWDARYHAPDGPLSELRNLTPTPANLRKWLMDDLDPRFIKPLGALFSMLAPIAQAVGVILAQVKELNDAVKAKLDGIVSGPDSLTGITDSVQQLLQRLKDLNVNFLRDSLKDLFKNIRDKLDALNPAHIRATVEQAFSDMLATIGIGLVLPPADVAKLDDDYKQVIDKLKALDPGKLVIDVVQPIFEQKILPLIAAFDITPLLNAIVDRLNGLEAELKGEIDKVNVAFKAMLDAVPKVGLGDVAGAVGDVVGDIGGSIGF